VEEGGVEGRGRKTAFSVQRRADGGILDACKKSKTRSLVVLLTNRKDYGHFEVIVFFEINAVV